MSYSQFGEDVVVDSLLRNQKHGVYVDVGAFDPVLYSNTYYFYTKGWRGLVIDPNPSVGKKFALLRPRDTFAATGVAEVAASRTYYEFNDAAYNTFDETERENYLQGNSTLRVTRSYMASLVPLGKILEEKKIESVDFLSIDAQGFDLQVLKSMGSVRPRVIAVEAGVDIEKLHTSEMYTYLRDCGYTLAGVAGLTLLFVYNK